MNHDFNITSQDKLSYSGSIIMDIEKQSGDHLQIVEHNEGRLPLFNAIVRLLAGENVIAYKPAAMMLCNETGGNITNLLTSPAYFAHSPTLYRKEGSSYTAIDSAGEADTIQYSCVVPRVMVKSQVGSTDIICNKIRLLNAQVGASDNICAEVNLTSAVNLSSIQNITIYWRLNIDNATASNFNADI